MIYSIPKSEFPKSISASLRDLNDFSWEVAQDEKGFYIQFKGPLFFQDTYLTANASMGYHLINNTGTFFFPKGHQDILQIKYCITANFTDEIWECLESIFCERLKENLTLLPSEIVE
jgi:hypothetical protein